MKDTPTKILLSLTKILSPLTRAACAMLFALAAVALTICADARQSGRQPVEKKNAASAQPSTLLKRTTTRHEVRRVGFGGSVTIYGAPEGSITVEAWQKGDVEITADIEQSAGTEEELTRLAAVNSFVVDEDVNHLRLMTVGVHDRKYVKRVARDLPKICSRCPGRLTTICACRRLAIWKSTPGAAL